MLKRSRQILKDMRRARGRLDESWILRALEGPGEDLASALADRAPNSALAAAAFCRVLRILGREPEAQEAMDQALERFPRSQPLILEAAALARHRHEPIARGWQFLGTGDIEGARAAFIEAIRLVGSRVPTSALAATLCAYGWVEQAAGLPLAALGAFDRAARSDPKLLDAWYGLGMARRSLGQERAARPVFGRAGRLGPLAPAPLAMIGWCHYEQARFVVAERAFRRALLRQPRDLEAHWGLAWTLWRRGESADLTFGRALEIGWHESARDLLPVLEARPGSSAALLALARRALAPAPAMAESAARIVLVRGDAAAAEILGAALSGLGRHEEIEALIAEYAGPGLLAVALKDALERGDDGLLVRLLDERGDLVPTLLRITALERLGRQAEALELARRSAAEGEPGAAERAGDLGRRLGRSRLRDFDSAAPAGRGVGFDAEVLLARDLRRARSRADEVEQRRILADLAPDRLQHLREEITGQGSGGRALLARLLAHDTPTARGSNSRRDVFTDLARLLERAESRRRLGRLDRRRFAKLRAVLAEDDLARAAVRRIVGALADREMP